MPETEIPGFDAANPLGFLAALGALAVASRHWPRRRIGLAWSDSVRAHARLADVADSDELAEAILVDLAAWRDSPALDYPSDKPWKDIKRTGEEVREWLNRCLDHRHADAGRALALASALVAEGSVDNSGKAKPTDLHFTAGQQQFLDMARKLRDGLEREHVIEALEGPWQYTSELPSFKWDVTDDRTYALSATNPAVEKKLTVPGAEWLALQGLTLMSVVGVPNRTLTPGCGGRWKDGTFTWPVWTEALDIDSTRSLLTLPALQAEPIPDTVAAHGITRVLRSRITRSDQGGYGSFRPPRLVFDSASPRSAI